MLEALEISKQTYLKTYREALLKIKSDINNIYKETYKLTMSNQSNVKN
ncbi:Uncharacterised protein [Mycoplasmopsis arginini]|nr:Uncharacterised protein [Chlamydia trachomatis]SGA02303.1 Uncharacterised protein [Chlamydia abortus]SGA06717.1 Uncharacterised protein [Mycoplasmopsis arginini]CRH47354.1 Uncharacterised protein [Chlamydia trachomatis]CRH55073.1 Uncharacterised protein [Chlamydia trachomatis]